MGRPNYQVGPEPVILKQGNRFNSKLPCKNIVLKVFKTAQDRVPTLHISRETCAASHFKTRARKSRMVASLSSRTAALGECMKLLGVATHPKHYKNHKIPLSRIRQVESSSCMHATRPGNHGHHILTDHRRTPHIHNVSRPKCRLLPSMIEGI